MTIVDLMTCSDEDVERMVQGVWNLGFVWGIAVGVLVSGVTWWWFS